MRLHQIKIIANGLPDCAALSSRFRLKLLHTFKLLRRYRRTQLIDSLRSQQDQCPPDPGGKREMHANKPLRLVEQDTHTTNNGLTDEKPPGQQRHNSLLPRHLPAPHSRDNQPEHDKTDKNSVDAVQDVDIDEMSTDSPGSRGTERPACTGQSRATAAHIRSEQNQDIDQH